MRTVSNLINRLDAKEAVLGPLSPVDSGRRIALRNRLEQLYREESEIMAEYRAACQRRRVREFQAPRSILVALGPDERPGRGRDVGYIVDDGNFQYSRNRKKL